MTTSPPTDEHHSQHDDGPDTRVVHWTCATTRAAQAVRFVATVVDPDDYDVTLVSIERSGDSDLVTIKAANGEISVPLVAGLWLAEQLPHLVRATLDPPEVTSHHNRTRYPNTPQEPTP